MDFGCPRWWSAFPIIQYKIDKSENTGRSQFHEKNPIFEEIAKFKKELSFISEECQVA